MFLSLLQLCTLVPFLIGSHSIPLCNLYVIGLLYLQVGKALFDGQLLDVHFTRSFYKHILGVKVTYHDIEAIDPDYFKNLKWMLEVCCISLILVLCFPNFKFLHERKKYKI